MYLFHSKLRSVKHGKKLIAGQLKTFIKDDVKTSMNVKYNMDGTGSADNAELNRHTYSISFKCEDGYKLVGLDSNITACKYFINDTGLDILGREHPETCSTAKYVIRFFLKGEHDYKLIDLKKINGSNILKAVEKVYPFDSSYGMTLANKRMKTFIRQFNDGVYTNKSRVPKDSTIVLNYKKFDENANSQLEYLSKYFYEFIPSESNIVVPNIDIEENELKDLFSKYLDITNRIYFIGFDYDTTVKLRDFADKVSRY